MFSSVHEVVIGLLRELPANRRVWTTVERTYTAGDMVRLIEENTAEGRQYVLDTLRLCRDIIAHSGRSTDPTDIEINDLVECDDGNGRKALGRVRDKRRVTREMLDNYANGIACMGVTENAWLYDVEHDDGSYRCNVKPMHIRFIAGSSD